MSGWARISTVKVNMMRISIPLGALRMTMQRNFLQVSLVLVSKESVSAIMGSSIFLHISIYKYRKTKRQKKTQKRRL